MLFERQVMLCSCVLFTMLLSAVSTESVMLSGGVEEAANVIQKYFPHENTLCVVLSEPDTFLPTFHVPVILHTQEQVFQDCSSKLTEQEGYVIVTSNAENLEGQIIPLLKCFNQTTLKLKTKYILVFHISDDENSNETYSSFFLKLWKSYGIINISIAPSKVYSQNSNLPVIVSYNPFLALQHSSSNALLMITLSQDIRVIMIGRFRNMHGYRLKTVFYKVSNKVINLKDLKKKQTLGGDPRLLFKQTLEWYLNTSFDAYEPLNKAQEGTPVIGAMEEVISGKAEFCLNFFFLKSSVVWPKTLQLMQIGYGFELIFVVPMPKQIESWQLFQYIFQWPVSLGLGLVLLLLSAVALLFVNVHSKTKPQGQNCGATSEVVSVWKAALSISINRFPATHSQRLLIAWSLLLGLIFVTAFSVQLFALMKSKPRSASIKTLHELQDSNLPIYTIINTFALVFKSFENTSLSKLKDNFKTDENLENADYLNPKYLNITDRAIVYTSDIIKEISSLPQNKEYLQLFEVVKEPILQTLLFMYFPIGSVYFDHCNDLNLRLLSGGFYIKWVKANTAFVEDRSTLLSSQRAQDIPQADDTKAQDGDDRVPLTYDDLKMAFYILYIGLTISAVCFLWEVSHR